jgi:nucleotide-binding universal stress UspA family protein
MSVNYQKIMITLDGSAFAAQALPHACSLAQKYNASLILFQVIPEGDQPMIESVALDLIGVHDASERARTQVLTEVTKSLQEQAHQLQKQGIRAIPAVAVGNPAETIIDCASEEGVDLIVMSTHGRSGVNRWVYGSVADKVLRGASCPVLLVRLVVT